MCNKKAKRFRLREELEEELEEALNQIELLEMERESVLGALGFQVETETKRPKIKVRLRTPITQKPNGILHGPVRGVSCISKSGGHEIFEIGQAWTKGRALKRAQKSAGDDYDCEVN